VPGCAQFWRVLVPGNVIIATTPSNAPLGRFCYTWRANRETRLIGSSLAFGQVRRLNGLAELVSVFQRDDLGPDVAARGLGFWKASLAAKAAITVSCVETRIPQADSGPDRVIDEVADAGIGR
jgi:hypothetical protein